ncbi:cytochrome P450-like protein [Tribolium castaneum]|uniref:Cytochrome P450-like protein n=2 Tax=Tribolium castaneum TaxID=7070 RepID=D2A4X0_TRICA|nr:PREDICTED: cytochrome P450 4C1 [Tribolium castaneum]XP_015836246.1 PREDICTED: cytochrome P450 4C1 [Tribolium castaneum]EFA05709.1 cytochrome P450-like protein [Tribolium castaneum]|eukprot:XP_008194529.1 PREDICTED: cytochrome P450 4C1 [Tribolium castaneum]
MNFETINTTSALTWALLFIVLFFIIKYNWNRRWLYYYGSKIDGPFAWPIIGIAHYFIGGQKVFYNQLTKLFEAQPPIFKFWLGQDLVVATSRLKDVEIILNNCFEKPKFYNFMCEVTGNGLLTARENIWKERRKMINQAFSLKVLHSYVDIFSKRAKCLISWFEEDFGKEDVFFKLYRCTFDTACEALADVDPTLLHGKNNYINNLKRMIDILTIRSFSIWLHDDFFWKLSPLSKEMSKASAETFSFIKQIIGLKKLDPKNHTSKRFLNHLLTLNETNPKFDDSAIEEELQTILITSSESTALTVGMILTVLGIYPEIQKKVSKELDSIFGHDDRETTLEDVQKMKYLECVIKETSRVLPAVPLLARLADKDIKLDNYTIPAGSIIVIPIWQIGKNADFWKNPKKFDPDRFLPENCDPNRPRSSFIPFSYGPRNCIGFQYSNMLVKVLTATILRKYTIKCPQYTSFEQVEIIFSITARPKHGFKIQMEKKL